MHNYRTDSATGILVRGAAYAVVTFWVILAIGVDGETYKAAMADRAASAVAGKVARR